MHIRALIFGVLAAASCTASERSPLTVAVDAAVSLPLGTGPAHIVIGNPTIAEVNAIGTHAIVVTGRAPGTTNILLLAPGGEVQREIGVNVVAGATVTIHRGLARESYVCAPLCEGVLLPNDDAAYQARIAEGMARRMDSARAATSAAER